MPSMKVYAGWNSVGGTRGDPVDASVRKGHMLRHPVGQRPGAGQVLVRRRRVRGLPLDDHLGDVRVAPTSTYIHCGSLKSLNHRSIRLSAARTRPATRGGACWPSSRSSACPTPPGPVRAWGCPAARRPPGTGTRLRVPGDVVQYHGGRQGRVTGAVDDVGDRALPQRHGQQGRRGTGGRCRRTASAERGVLLTPKLPRRTHLASVLSGCRGSGRDLQRGRDHGVATYNQLRNAYRLRLRRTAAGDLS